MGARIPAGPALAIALALFVAINVIAGATLGGLRLDLTQHQLYTLAPGTRNVLAGLEEPISLRLYYSARTFAGIPQLQGYGARVRDLLEEYAARANGRIELAVIDPEPFSEAEDQAVASGIRQVPAGSAGEIGYLGIVGTNSTDDEQVIPLLLPSQEQSLEYDLTRLVYALSHPKRPVVGIVGALPMFGAGANPMLGIGPQPPWAIVSALEQNYEVRNLGVSAAQIDPKRLDVLLVVHPKALPAPVRYAVDQFVMKGGKAIVFVDPLAEQDPATPDPSAMVMPERSSDLPELLSAWGARMTPGRVAADTDAAIRVTFQGPRGPQEVPYLPWLTLTASNLDAADKVTRGLRAINLASAGVLEPVPAAGTAFVPLLRTGPNAATLEAEGLQFVRDPSGLLPGFKPGGRPLVIAARLQGPARSAFPGGPPADPQTQVATQDPSFVARAVTPIQVVVVADTDVLADQFWVQIRNVLGTRAPTPLADNADFVINAIDNLLGNDDLVSLRSRGESLRPFERVEALGRQAEMQFRSKEQELQEALQQTERRILDLEAAGGDKAGAAILSTEQKKAIESFREEQLRIRRELRGVQHDLNRDIEALGTRLKLVNIAGVPLLIAGAALAVAIAGRIRRRVPSA
ncbi:MAG: GldG family protein [Gammaproteobacteria bacterium]